MKLHRRAEIMQRRTDVQDLPAMFFQLRKPRATHVESSLQIDIHHGPKPVRRQPLRRAKKISRRAIYDDVDLPKLLDRDRKSTRLNSSHTDISRMPSSA